MREIPLTQGKVALIDDEDLPLVSGYKWCALRKNSVLWYAKTNIRLPNGWRGTLYLHRLLLGAHSGELVDHKDGDGLNCQRYNMRLATCQQNSRNQRKTRGASQFKGVSPGHNAGGFPWQAGIKVNGLRIYLGMYRTEEAAARAYDARAIELFGEFARLNF